MISPTPSSVKRAKRVLSDLLIAATAFGLLTQFAPVARADSPAEPGVPDPVSVVATETSGAQEIAEAAAAYEEADAASAAELVAAVSNSETISFEDDAGELVASSAPGVETRLSEEGELTLIASGMPEIGIALAGGGELVDGALVQSEVSAGTATVVRPTELGVQLVAVLENEEADTNPEFELDLSDGARLEGRPDGSVAIIAPVSMIDVAPGEAERIVREIEAVLGSDFDYVDRDLTAAQVDQLEAIVPARTVYREIDVEIAHVGAPWAVDAAGTPLTTFYEIDGNTIRQTVVTDSGTQYPVTADPTLAWYIEKALGCVVSLGAYALGAAKLVQVGAKVVKALKAGKAGSALNKAYKAWQTLGKTDGERLSNLLWNLKVIAELVVKHGITKAKSLINSRGGSVLGTWVVVTGGASVLLDIIGIRDCISLATGK